MGLLSDNSRRGASFGLLFAAYPLGSLCGGAVVGHLIAWQGYPTMFTVLAMFWVLLPLLGVLGLRGLHIQHPVRVAQGGGDTPPLGRPFKRLLLVGLLGALGINIGRLGVSLSMQSLGFEASAVASTAAVSGLIVMPVSMLMSTLADRLGQRRVLITGYGLAVGGALVLLVATHLWQFWLAATVLFVAWCVNGAMTSALATDTLAPAALGRGLPRLNATDSLASMLGFLAAGYGMDQIGSTGLYLAATALLVLAAPLVGTVRQPKHTVSVTQIAEELPLGPRAPLTELERV
jgi:MFS family permease